MVCQKTPSAVTAVRALPFGPVSARQCGPARHTPGRIGSLSFVFLLPQPIDDPPVDACKLNLQQIYVRIYSKSWSKNSLCDFHYVETRSPGWNDDEHSQETIDRLKQQLWWVNEELRKYKESVVAFQQAKVSISSCSSLS